MEVWRQIDEIDSIEENFVLLKKNFTKAISDFDKVNKSFVKGTFAEIYQHILKILNPLAEVLKANASLEKIEKRQN